MKFENLLRLPRSARTLQLVINIPEPAVSSAAPSEEPEQSAWARLWKFLKVLGPVAVSITALIIAVLSLTAQDNANLQQSLTGKAAEAPIAPSITHQVSFRQGSLPQSYFAHLAISNNSATPAFNVTFQVGISIVAGPEGDAMKAFTLWLGNMPACSSGIADIRSGVIEVMQNIVGPNTLRVGVNTLKISVISMSFADSTGAYWQYSAIGGLHQIGNIGPDASLPGAAPMNYIQARYRASSACI